MTSKLLKGKIGAQKSFTQKSVKNIVQACQDSGTLEITVLEARSEEPVANVLVGLSGPKNGSGNTDSSGRITFSCLPPGDYTVDIKEEEVDIAPSRGGAKVESQQLTKARLEVKRKLRTVKIKRKHISLKGDDKYGHWWVEIAVFEGQSIIEQESYGWWPASGVGLWDTLAGTKGVLNGIGYFTGGSGTQDPHHGDAAEDDFHPYIRSGSTAKQVKDCMRSFAKSYSGEWRWTFGAGQNCHTFQEEMMSHCKLSED